MKLLAVASLAALGQAAPTLEDYLMAQFEKHVQIDDYRGTMKIDFSPYLNVDMSDYGMTGSVKSSFGGEDVDEDNWNFDAENMKAKQWGKNHGSNMAAMGLPVAKVINYVDYEFNTGFDQGSLTLSADKKLTFRFVNGQRGNVVEDASIRADLAMGADGPDAITLNINAKRTNSGMGIINNYDAHYLTDPYVFKATHNTDFTNMAGCGVGKGCKIDLKMDASFGERSFEEQINVNTLIEIKKLALVIKHTNSMIPGDHLVFLRGEDEYGRDVAILDGEEYFGIYYSPDSKNWKKALKSDDTMLVLRFPSPGKIESACLPELEKMVEPFMNFVEKCYESMEKIPYVIFYLDELLADFDDEFDCSALVRSTKLESDLYPGGLNADLQAGCRDMNQEIVETLQCPELDNAWGQMRSYVRTMASGNGAQDFQNIFGNIF